MDFGGPYRNPPVSFSFNWSKFRTTQLLLVDLAWLFSLLIGHLAMSWWKYVNSKQQGAKDGALGNTTGATEEEASPRITEKALFVKYDLNQSEAGSMTLI